MRNDHTLALLACATLHLLVQPQAYDLFRPMQRCAQEDTLECDSNHDFYLYALLVDNGRPRLILRETNQGFAILFRAQRDLLNKFIDLSTEVKYQQQRQCSR